MLFTRGSRLSSGLTQVMLPPLATFISMYLAAPARAELPPLIPREALVPKPSVMQSIRLSPDGRLISYLGADSAGVKQLWVRDEPSGSWRVRLGADESYELAVEAFSEDGQALLLRTDLCADTTGLVWRRIQVCRSGHEAGADCAW